MKLDTIDIRILAKLQADGRITKLKLADHVNLSPSACFERVERLTEQGLIKGYHADIDFNRLIKVDMVIVQIVLASHQLKDFERFEKAIRHVPEVIECIAVGGGVDYFLKFVVTSISHYQELFEQILAADVGIDRYFSYIVTKVIQPQGAFPLEHLLARAGAGS